MEGSLTSAVHFYLVSNVLHGTEMMSGNRKKDEKSLNERKKSFLESLAQISFLKPGEKNSDKTKREGREENKFSFNKYNEKKQLQTDWRKTCTEMNIRAQNLQVSKAVRR